MSDEKAQEWAEFRAAVFELGLGEHVETLVALCRPSVRLWPREPTTGRTQLGGSALLPRGFVWPMGDSVRPGSTAPEPMQLVAQLDLAALPMMNELPRAGLLSFFHGWRTGPTPEHAGNAGAVHFFGPEVELFEQRAPDGVVELPCHGLEPELLTEQLPPFESPFYALLSKHAFREGRSPYELVDERLLQLLEWYGPAESVREEADRPVHRLLGFAESLQSDVCVNTEGNSAVAPLSSWHTQVHFERAAGWRSLLQLDSDLSRDVLFGDGGVLSFMLRADDLAAHRFDRVWCDWQSA